MERENKSIKWNKSFYRWAVWLAGCLVRIILLKSLHLHHSYHSWFGFVCFACSLSFTSFLIIHEILHVFFLWLCNPTFSVMLSPTIPSCWLIAHELTLLIPPLMQFRFTLCRWDKNHNMYSYSLSLENRWFLIRKKNISTWIYFTWRYSYGYNNYLFILLNNALA